MSKRILVTGGAGFISSNFIHHLLAKTPYEVVSLDALTYAGNVDNLSGAMSHERLSFVQGDIRDADLVREIVAAKRSDLAEAAAELIDVANQNGGRDNVSVVVIRVPAEFLPTGGWLQRWMTKKPA